MFRLFCSCCHWLVFKRGSWVLFLHVGLLLSYSMYISAYVSCSIEDLAALFHGLLTSNTWLQTGLWACATPFLFWNLILLSEHLIFFHLFLRKIVCTIKILYKLILTSLYTLRFQTHTHVYIHTYNILRKWFRGIPLYRWHTYSLFALLSWASFFIFCFRICICFYSFITILNLPVGVLRCIFIFLLFLCNFLDP